MDSVEKLDFVLDIIVKQVPNYITIDGIISEINRKIGQVEYMKNFMFDLQMIIEMLIDDGYIKTIELEPKNLNTQKSDGLKIHYQSTFKGKFLSEARGYAGLDEQRLSENTRLVNLEKNQKFHRCALTVLTLIIAVGTLIAAIYYGIEVMKYWKWIPQN